MSNPNDLLSRNDAADALTQAGFRISAATLATMATRGGGPHYRLFGTRAMYSRADLMAWAEARTSRPVATAAELGIKRALSAALTNSMNPRM